MEGDFDWWAPEYLMLAAEWRTVSRLLREREHLDEARRVRDINGINDAKRECRALQRRQTITTKLDELIMAVMRREAGLSPYMVLDVQREDGYSARLQALSFGIHEGRWSGEWLWCIHGRRLRRDASLGTLNGGICFRFANLWRRRLDGVWQRLHPSNSEGG